MRASGFRLRLTPAARALRVVVYGACLVVLAVQAAGPDGATWRLLSAVGAGLALVALRMMTGRVVLVDEHHLTLQLYWPLRRRIPWYRIAQVEIDPGSWSLVVELNSGARLALPCVEPFDELYERVEHHRKALDVPR